MRTNTAPVIRLEDYTPPAYTVRHVNLDIDLHAEKTHVIAKLSVERMADIAVSEPLWLDGDELKLVSISVDGEKLSASDYTLDDTGISVSNLPATNEFQVEIETSLAPEANTKLMGLYLTNGVYCTQCEAQGFRRITFFPDRPDVLATYDVRLEGYKAQCPILLSNGNPGETGASKDGRHFAHWHDPHPKPSYLFAAVGGDLDVLNDSFTTASGMAVDLNIFVETGKAPMAAWAMDSLIRSMRWDEEKYGREYDLDVFNIVAVSDFNMGAMENKGLNVFNDKYVLADERTATDADFANIEAIIAHEYFHNWTGNRITCRDWFQLCLKEGLTVYRDQEFSADERSRAVQRIQQVRTLMAGQFSEDSGPLAHSVRPAAYKEINNFYTATVYQKGAEVVRMLAALVGPEAYRKATDLYFERHDGEAAVVEDWLAAFEDSAGIDLTQFKRWYAQAGTPRVTARGEYDADAKSYTLRLSQETAPTPGQDTKQPFVIPMRFGLMSGAGEPISASHESEAVTGGLIVLDEAEQIVTFIGLNERPVLSLLQGFSAPVRLDFDESDEDRLVRAAHDSDQYNRWEALSGFALKQLAAVAGNPKFDFDSRLIETLAATALDNSLEAAFRAAAITLPSEGDIARELEANIDPDAIYAARSELAKRVGGTLGETGFALALQLDESQKSSDPLQAAAERSLSTALWQLLVASEVKGATTAVVETHRASLNMTVRLSTLSTMLRSPVMADESAKAIENFLSEFTDEPLVIDKWFSVQAASPGEAGLKTFETLLNHPLYTLSNPNRARALLAPFAASNPTAFHRADGSGVALFADTIIELDRRNPQLAARLLSLMNDWRKLEPVRAEHAREALSKVAGSTGLSVDTQEIADRALA
ncbi:aminopeptidase N [Ahrensia sp. R2A130]|uniref:aminopeptidase N n=1 Tax=Ahrensia sp. R2A130 TaxID=744979 RepID=UPI0001E0E8D9|nr:aminopeptidase N [Ahrensia sp. R2A130]EFL88983.1 aminopeptidase N [Ahrensia sp. R2A130]